MVFREASDAVRWCVAVQMELLLRNWQTATSGKCAEDVGIVTIPEAHADCPLPLAMKGLAQKKCPKVGTSYLCTRLTTSANNVAPFVVH